MTEPETSLSTPARTPDPLDGMQHCPVTRDGWILPPEQYPWRVLRRHYIFWEAIFSLNYIWVTAACFNFHMSRLFQTMPTVVWLMCLVRGAVLFTSLYSRISGRGLRPLLIGTFTGNLALTLILILHHHWFRAIPYSPITLVAYFEVLYQVFVLGMAMLPAYRWPLQYWMLRAAADVEEAPERPATSA